jgi:hypothetical protein
MKLHIYIIGIKLSKNTTTAAQTFVFIVKKNYQFNIKYSADIAASGFLNWKMFLLGNYIIVAMVVLFGNFQKSHIKRG